MERLTENVLGNIQLKACVNDFCKETCAEHDEEKSCDNCPIQKAFEKIAEYEDLEEQEKLLMLPCKVGDTVYWVNNWFVRHCSGLINDKWHITESKVYGFFYSRLGLWIRLENEENFRISEIGKTVFLTHQEAEDKLKEMEEKNGN